MRETTIPFSGFYESIHACEIDSALENRLSDSSGCNPVSERISDEIYLHTGDVSEVYARRYLEDFQSWLAANCDVDVKLHYAALSSPKYYNFSTDRIFAGISSASVRKLYRAVDKALLDKVIKDSFTSYDGFCSSYEPNRAAWGKLEDWDHNQIGTILCALIKQSGRRDWEYEIIEDANLTGNFDAVTCDVWACTAAGLDGDVLGHRGHDTMYRHLADAYRNGAALVSLAPAALQAIVWIAIRGKHE